jgi:hypothetical protein
LKVIISKAKGLLTLKNFLASLTCCQRRTRLKAGDKIQSEEFLLRRVYFTDKKYVKPDGSLSSRAFAPRPKDDGKLSVDIESLIVSWDTSIRDPTKFRLYKIQALLPYSIGLSCIYDPLTIKSHNEDNPAHAYISGFDKEDESKPKILAINALKVAYPR